MIIVAARPAVGKSTLALDFCRSASIHNNLTSVIFSLEMSKSEITMRLLSAEAKIPLNNIRKGPMTDDDWNKLGPKMGQVSGAPMFIDDSPNMTMMEIRAKARRLKQRHDLKLIVIDYLQLMTSGKKVESRQVEVSEFSRQIKLLAKELDVPIVALSQLNRGPEQRSDKRPMMSDLRESGSIEQDADIVMLLHREDVYETRVTPRRRGRHHRRQAPQRPHPRRRGQLPGPLLALRRHGPLRLTGPRRRRAPCRRRRPRPPRGRRRSARAGSGGAAGRRPRRPAPPRRDGGGDVGDRARASSRAGAV